SDTSEVKSSEEETTEESTEDKTTEQPAEEKTEETEETAEESNSGGSTHIVSAEDNLYRIAIRYYGSGSSENVNKIMDANGITPDSLSVGQELVIPEEKGAYNETHRNNHHRSGTLWHVSRNRAEKPGVRSSYNREGECCRSHLQLSNTPDILLFKRETGNRRFSLHYRSP